MSENSNQQEFINDLFEFSLPDLLLYSVDGKPMITRMGEQANICNSMGIFVIMNDHSMNHGHVCDMNDLSMNLDHVCAMNDHSMNRDHVCDMNDHSMNCDHVCDMNDHSMNPDHASLCL